MDMTLEEIKDLLEVAESDIWKLAERTMEKMITVDGTDVPFPLDPHKDWDGLNPLAVAIVDHAEAQIDAYNTVRNLMGLPETKLPRIPDHIKAALPAYWTEKY